MNRRALSRIQCFATAFFFGLLGAHSLIFAEDDTPTVSPAALLDTPHHVLKGKDFTAIVALPSPEHGFYRGRRFEAGQVAFVGSAAHTFVGTRGEDSRPIGSLGLCGEFIQPLVLPAALSGRADMTSMIRVGVGQFLASVRPGAKLAEMEVIRLFPWQVETTANAVRLRQDVHDESGYGYFLEKEIALDPDSDRITITWRLQNSGTLRMQTRHYSHNWLMLDGKTRSSDLRLEVPFEFVGHIDKFFGHNGFRIRPKSLLFVPEGMKKPDAASFLSAPGIEGTNSARLIDTMGGASVEISNSWSPFDFVVYADDKGFCPESFLGIDIEPGHEITWQTTYTFGTSTSRASSP